MKNKWLRYIDYLTKDDPYLFRKYDYLIGETLDKAKELLPNIKFHDWRVEQTCTLETKHNWISVRTNKENIIEEIDSIYVE